MKISTLLKWVTGGCEAFLAIPIAGGAFIFSNAWFPLLFMFIFHLITLVVSAKEKRSYAGSILGMITSAIGAIPIIGWIMHTITAIVLLIDAGRSTRLDNKA
ncbi:hypothetical protein SAMN05192559_105260 [Halobacillus karajensis]|uniref:Uncharacterized protein n=1 Tax=Halobacillus karajensis TaxID=195088 RepID=A0A024P5K1_9BACI|nr:hypothetical protein [Halobacillus karajensis]CDQ20478.1 hypothetical protein BN982_02819 [Halobacillus karajensis]CDQ24053.1 hypothetical protein BN983_02318 [Halobacillus karajensis]CDQ27531.1 hypothetical protein BN981_01799 [Halobacillus karajensis]SEH91118.1 hypothetical protein SAMN05192559_105260 [Halobacillus karajensis]